MKCPRCLRDNRPVAKLCDQCGTPLKEIAPSASSYADLEDELKRARGSLREALEQQAATASILRAISGSPANRQSILDAIAANAARVCGAYDATVLLRENDLMRGVTHHGPIGSWVNEMRSITRGSASGIAILDRKPVHVHDVLTTESTEFADSRESARESGFRTLLAVPLLRENAAIGALAIRRRHVQPFTDQQVALLQTFADQAVIAIENVRLFDELQTRNRDLTDALDRETATSEILRVISRSPTAVQPVFEAIAESAVRLCGGVFGGVFRFDGTLLHFVAGYRFSDAAMELLNRQHPMPPRGLNREAITERGIVHSADVFTDTRAANLDLARTLGYRSNLVVPMLRNGEPIGTIAVFGAEAAPFSDTQISLVQTFADQAVIAVENARLFTELQEKHRALAEAHAQLTETLEQQMATAEILHTIAASPTEIQPVLDTIARNAARVCNAVDASVALADTDTFRIAARFGPLGTPIGFELPLDRGSMPGRAILDRTTIHVNDAREVPESEYPLTYELSRRFGHRSVVATPLLREGMAIGALYVRRTEVRPFTDSELGLLNTFAAQAVIAIENVRLFNELGARNRELSTALDQQTATSEILRVISSSPTDVQPVFESLVTSAARLCGAEEVNLLVRDGDTLRAPAGVGALWDSLPRDFRVPLVRTSVAARAVVDGATIHVEDLAAESEEEYAVGKAMQRRFGHHTSLAVPLLREGVAVGTLFASRFEVRPFADQQIALLKTFADQAVIAIENVRLFKELEARNRDLTATSEILRVIASSPTDLQPVFDTIAERSMRLCQAAFVWVLTFDGQLLHLRSLANVSPESADALRRLFPVVPSRGTAAGRTILTAEVVQIPDVLTDPEYEFNETADATRSRSVLTVPLLHRGRPIGVIAATRPEPGAFSEEPVQLLKTFADQAVIAIENVRLFNELQARTAQLTRSVEQLTALGDVGRAVSSTLDVETVLEMIVSRASQLARADGCAIYEYNEMTDDFNLRATDGFAADVVEATRATPLRKGEGVMGRAAETREPVQVADITQPGAYQSSVRDALVGAGYRAALSVPLLREEQIIGSLSLARKTPGAFSEETVELLKTFATQSALAIQNARLFREIEEKSRQLEIASHHKSEFLANMSHELRTPLNAIIGFSEALTERMFGELNDKQEEYLKDIHSSGQHLLSLINDILDLSKIEAGRMELELGDFDLPTAIDNALILVRERAGRHGIALFQAIDERLGMVRGDERKVKQVLLNLLSNALKFTQEGGRVDVRADLVDGMARISVADTGVGIAPEDQGAVFEEFRQVGTAAKKIEGTGLGLALARKFIELHGGRIWLKSEVGLGSTFTFTIPIRGSTTAP